MRLRDSGEMAFLRALRQARGAADGGLRLGIGDDAALLDCPPGHSLVLTCDAALEGRHFRRDWLAGPDIGDRAVRCALSDLAAMGAQPAAVLLTLVVSPDEHLATAQAIVEGAVRAAETFGAHLVGGETVGNDGPLMLDVLAAGFVAEGRGLRRSGARPGDSVLVSGTLGDSAAGLALLQSGREAPAEAIRRYRRPTPRIALGRALAANPAVHAAIDISDGLVQDAGHVAEAGGVGLLLRAHDLPLSPALRQAAEQLGQDALAWALTGGEDFELLFCAARDTVEGLVARAPSEAGVPVCVVGEVVEGEGVRVVGADGSELPIDRSGWDHFRSG